MKAPLDAYPAAVHDRIVALEGRVERRGRRRQGPRGSLLRADDPPREGWLVGLIALVLLVTVGIWVGGVISLVVLVTAAPEPPAGQGEDPQRLGLAHQPVLERQTDAPTCDAWQAVLAVRVRQQQNGQRTATQGPGTLTRSVAPSRTTTGTSRSSTSDPAAGSWTFTGGVRIDRRRTTA